MSEAAASSSSAPALPPVMQDLVLSEAGNPDAKIPLRELYGAKPIILVFLRRLGCQLCRVFAQDLEEIRSEVASLGGEIIAVSHEYTGTGSDKDRSWEAGGYFKGRLLVDADKKVYKDVLGRKGFFSGLFTMSKKRRAQVKERKVDGNFSGDGFQLGGVFVIDTDGSVLLSHVQEFFGDDPSNEELLAALGKAKGLAAGGAGVPTA